MVDAVRSSASTAFARQDLPDKAALGVHRHPEARRTMRWPRARRKVAIEMLQTRAPDLHRNPLAPMELLDKVFEIVFARMRRKTGNSNLERAWHRASNRVAGYLALPFGAATVVLAVVIYAVSGEGTRIQHRHWGQLIAWVAGVLAIVLLNRRFKKYLSAAPALPATESAADTRLVFWFRTISLGSFALTCLIGLVLHYAGFRFLQGL